MIPFVLLLAGSTLAAPPGSARPFPLRLERGQEFIFHANYTQESDRPDSNISCYLDTYVLILEGGPSPRAAFMTVQRALRRAGAESAPIARLESGRIDALGRVTLDSASSLPCLPVDGPPTLETVPFLEMPQELPPPGQTWQVPDRDWGMKKWRILMEEKHELGRSLKLKSEQSNGDWNTLGRLVWKREEFVTLLQNEGLIARTERITEWRTTSGERLKSTCVLALDSIPAPLPAGQFEERNQEITGILHYSRELAELMRPRGEPDLRGYDYLRSQLDRHARRGTPYEIAFQSLRRQIEAARNGERPPDPIVIPPHDISISNSRTGSPAGVDQFAPDISLHDSGSNATISLSSQRGQPVVLLLMESGAETTDRFIRYARAAASAYAGRVHVILAAVDGDTARLQKLRGMYRLPLPIYDGREVISRFAGKSATRVVVIDAKGVVRMIAPDWREEYSDQIGWTLVKIMQE